MSSLAPCDLGDGIEVVHDVESLEIEMECDLDDGAPAEPAPADDIETINGGFDKLGFDANEDLVATATFSRELNADDLVNTATFSRELSADDLGNTATFSRELNADDLGNTATFSRELNADDLGTHQFVRDSAPYERIEIQLDSNAFVRATIEHAKTKQRVRDSSC